MIGPSQLGDVMPDVVLAATETQVAKQREIPRLTTRDDLTRIHRRLLTRPVALVLTIALRA